MPQVTEEQVHEAMRTLMFAARMRGAESMEDAMTWAEQRGYVTANGPGEWRLTAAGLRRATNITNPDLDAEAMGLLQRWARAMRKAGQAGEEIPSLLDADAVVEWLKENDQIVPPTTVERAQEIVENGMLAFARRGA